jgi:GNAT superfamily N-acetyltransferase
MLTFRKATAQDIGLLSSLAREIWTTCYPGIITTEQIEYMLTLMYSHESIAQELQDNVQWVIIESDTDPIGFLSFTASDMTVKLNKLYLKADTHGKGFGKAGLNYVIDYAKVNGFKEVFLTVNKNNAKAIKAYEKRGFKLTESVVNDIGGGFVMDDYVYSYEI